MHELCLIERKSVLFADSREVAEMVDKQHKELLRDIRTYCRYLGESNFAQSDFFVSGKYLNEQNKKQPMFYLTKKGCDMVANKLTGAKGVRFTAAYINRFYEMEEALRSQKAARIDFPQFTDTVKRMHEEPRPYHFSNECDLINRIVLGMTAKQYKESHGIPKSEKSIRPYLTSEEIRLIDLMQKADIGLMVAERDFSKRKMYLEWYFNALTQSQLTA